MNKNLQSWYWAFSQGVVNLADAQAWAYAMIERMPHPPGWICDMATIDTKFKLAQRMRDLLEPCAASELRTDHFDLKVALDYLCYLKGDMTLRELLAIAAIQNYLTVESKQTFADHLCRYDQADARGAALDDLKSDADRLFARCFPQVTRYFEMRYRDPDIVAREIESATT